MNRKKFSLALLVCFGLVAGLAHAATADPANTPAVPATTSSAAPQPPAQPVPAAPGQPDAAAQGTPSAATAPAAANGAPFVPIDPQVAIQKADAYFNNVTTMVGDFVQISGDRRSEGKIYVQKPGKLRFEYADPASLDIIADGSTVAIIDREQRSDPEFYFIWQTPLKFLLKDKIDLARDVSVVGVTSDPNTVTITVEDKETFGGT
jgi:hypothetical protein